MVESMLVAAIVLVACLHVAWQLAPTLWRQPFALRLKERQQRGENPDGVGWRPLLLRMLRAPSAGCGDCGGRARCPAQQPEPNRQDIDRTRLIIVSRG